MDDGQGMLAEHGSRMHGGCVVSPQVLQPAVRLLADVNQTAVGLTSGVFATDAGAAAADLRKRLDAARQAAFTWATEATFGRSGCGAPKVPVQSSFLLAS